MIRGHNGQRGKPPGIERTHHRVVVHDVHVAHHVVGVNHVANLRERVADAGLLGTMQHPSTVDRARGIARREQQHLMAEAGEPAREAIDHRLRPPVAGWRHRCPRRSDHPDTQAVRLRIMHDIAHTHALGPTTITTESRRSRTANVAQMRRSVPKHANAWCSPPRPLCRLDEAAEVHALA